MIAKCLGLSFICGLIGLNGLFPSHQEPLTASQIQAKGKYRSISNVCAKKKKSKKVKEICERWERHE